MRVVLQNPIVRIAVFWIGWRILASLLMAPYACVVWFCTMLSDWRPSYPSELLTNDLVWECVLIVSAFTVLWILDWRMPGRHHRFRFEYLSELWLGIVIGAAAYLLNVGALYIGGWYDFSVAKSHYPLLEVVALFLLLSIAEEFVFRGVILRTLETSWGAGVALLASSLIFGIAHLVFRMSLMHDFVNYVLKTLLQAFCLGLLFGSAYLLKRRLWVPIGLHWAWDLIAGLLFGFYGYPPFVHPLYRDSAFGIAGPAYWMTTVVVLCTAALVYWKATNQRKETTTQPVSSTLNV